MKQQQALNSARRMNATVRPFRQPGGDCTGYVAAWIRNRAQDKDFWFNYFNRDEFSDDRSVTSRGQGKVSAIMGIEARDQTNAAQNNSTHRSAGVIRYICDGVRPDKPDKAIKHVLDWLKNEERYGSFRDAIASTLVPATFLKACSLRCYVLVGLAAPGNHAIGFDGSKGGARYFDPNLGELYFNDQWDFAEWFDQNWTDFGYAYTMFTSDFFKKAQFLPPPSHLPPPPAPPRR